MWSGGGLAAEDVLLLAPTRRAASRLRDVLAARLRRTSGRPVVRTAASAAFSVLRARAALLGEPAPMLISGPEQDLVLADLLAGHVRGEGAAVRWPASVPAGRVRCVPSGTSCGTCSCARPSAVWALPTSRAWAGGTAGRSGGAAAEVYEEYLDVTRLRAGRPTWVPGSTRPWSWTRPPRPCAPGTRRCRAAAGRVAAASWWTTTRR